MSPLDLLAPDSAEAAIPFSSRLAEKRLVVPARPMARPLPPQNRRAYERRPASELEWLRSVRLTGGVGYAVTLIDLSEGGALVEVDSPLRPGVRLTLELAGGGLDAAVPLEIVRSYVARIKGDMTIYRGACMFAHAIDLPTAMAAAPAARPRTPFVGAAAALRYLLEHSETDAPAGGRVTLARPDLLKVLESIHARGAASGDAVSRATLELLGAVLPAIQRGRSRLDAAAALECRYRTLPRAVQADLLATTQTIESLIARCFPDADAAEPEAASGDALAVAAAPSGAAAPRAGTDTDSAMQKIVVRYANGDLLKGFTQDFHPSRAQFSLWPGINATPSERVVVQVSSLKAVFFVRDFDGNPGHRDRKTFAARTQGRRVEVTFADTEVILGTTLNYRPDGQGFFVIPADPGGNNTRIFVVASAVRRVRFM
jgi:hypothetical protein